MKRLVSVTILLFFVTGCGGWMKGYNDFLKDIPALEAETLSYSRGGFYTSGSVVAQDIAIVDDWIRVGNLDINLNYPFSTFNIQLKEYRRQFTPEEASQTLRMFPAQVPTE